jgi:hypothetical protein
MTLAIPAELHKKMKAHPEIKWTEVARQAIEQKARFIDAEKDPWRLYALKRWAEEGEDAYDIIKF